MKFVLYTALILLLCNGCRKCPEFDGSLSINDNVWLPYGSHSKIYLTNGAGSIDTITVYLNNETESGAYQADGLYCPETFEKRIGSTDTLPGTLNLKLSFDLRKNQLLLKYFNDQGISYINKIYSRDDKIGYQDSVIEYLNTVTLNGIAYNNVVHYKSVASYAHCELYYGKSVGLIYFKEKYSAVGWYKL